MLASSWQFHGPFLRASDRQAWTSPFGQDYPWLSTLLACKGPMKTGLMSVYKFPSLRGPFDSEPEMVAACTVDRLQRGKLILIFLSSSRCQILKILPRDRSLDLLCIDITRADLILTMLPLCIAVFHEGIIPAPNQCLKSNKPVSSRSGFTFL